MTLSGITIDVETDTQDFAEAQTAYAHPRRIAKSMLPVRLCSPMACQFMETYGSLPGHFTVKPCITETYWAVLALLCARENATIAPDGGWVLLPTCRTHASYAMFVTEYRIGMARGPRYPQYTHVLTEDAIVLPRPLDTLDLCDTESWMLVTSNLAHIPGVVGGIPFDSVSDNVALRADYPYAPPARYVAEERTR